MMGPAWPRCRAGAAPSDGEPDRPRRGGQDPPRPGGRRPSRGSGRVRRRWRPSTTRAAGGGDRRRARCRSRSDADPPAVARGPPRLARLTLVLDNLEQLVDAAGDVATLVRSCPGREHRDDDPRPAADHRRGALRCRTAGDVGRSAGRTTGRAALPRSCRDVGVGLRTGAGDLDDVAELCARLDGVPLAIELAAARAAIVPPAEVLRHLDHVLDLLGTGRSDAPTQQRSMRAGSSGASGSCRRPPGRRSPPSACSPQRRRPQAAMVVWGVPASSTAAYFDLLQVLADSHLVAMERSDVRRRPARRHVRDDPAVRPRAARGVRSGELVRERVSEWAVGLVERAELPLAGPDQLAWLDLLDRELPNLRAVDRRLARARADDATTACASRPDCSASGTSARGGSRAERGCAGALDRPGGTPAVRARRTRRSA